MAFNQVIKGHSHGTALISTIIRMGAQLHDGKEAKHIAIRIPRLVLESIGWTRGSRIAVHEGVGTDAGFIMFAMSPDGYMPGHKTDAGSVHLKIGTNRFMHYVLNECPVQVEPVQYTIDNNAIIVEVPDWLRYIQPAEKSP